MPDSHEKCMLLSQAFHPVFVVLHVAASAVLAYLQVGVVLVRQRHRGGVLHLLLVLLEHGLVDLDLGRRKGGGGDEFLEKLANAFLEQRISYQGLVADEFPGEPQERLLKVVVGLGRDIVVLQVLLAVERDGLDLDFALLDVDLVAGEDDGDVLADADEVAWAG
jgi:hypothetical protein